MKNKLYQCKYPGCEIKQPILSKGLCAKHREQQRRENGEETFLSKKHPIRSIRKKTLDNRKEQRECLAAYYNTLIELLFTYPKCQNCGESINPYRFPHNNIAHILSKSSHKSVMCNVDNHIFLCDFKDNESGKSCHHDFDNKGFEFVKSMPGFPVILKQFEKIKPFVLEKTNIFLNFEAELDRSKLT